MTAASPAQPVGTYLLVAVVQVALGCLGVVPLGIIWFVLEQTLGLGLGFHVGSHPGFEDGNELAVLAAAMLATTTAVVHAVVTFALLKARHARGAGYWALGAVAFLLPFAYALAWPDAWRPF
jgi:hypothetical protein